MYLNPSTYCWLYLDIDIMCEFFIDDLYGQKHEYTPMEIFEPSNIQSMYLDYLNQPYFNN
jgi:hypothetical protein